MHTQQAAKNISLKYWLNKLIIVNRQLNNEIHTWRFVFKELNAYYSCFCLLYVLSKKCIVLCLFFAYAMCVHMKYACVIPLIK